MNSRGRWHWGSFKKPKNSHERVSSLHNFSSSSGRSMPAWRATSANCWWTQNRRGRGGVRRHVMKKSPPLTEYWRLSEPAPIGSIADHSRFRGGHKERLMVRHPRTLAVLSLVIGFVLCAIVHAARVPKTTPEIFSIEPGEGPAGTVVKVIGAGFEHTRYVLFAAGRTGQQAKFKVLSDKQLEVTAPNYL